MRFGIKTSSKLQAERQELILEILREDMTIRESHLSALLGVSVGPAVPVFPSSMGSRRRPIRFR
jgi:hypothetical protein